MLIFFNNVKKKITQVLISYRFKNTDQMLFFVGFHFFSDLNLRSN